jgi:hypothetical protein
VEGERPRTPHNGFENNSNYRGLGVSAKLYRGAARLAGFMPGPWASMKLDRRASRSLARLEIFEAVSGMERLGWPPAWANGSRISGQTKKWSGAAALEICQGSADGGKSASL